MRTGEIKSSYDECPINRLPDVLVTRIFALLPARLIAKSCAFVCRSWREASTDPSLWISYCESTGLCSADELKLNRGWRALYIAVYGPNLVANPRFEPIEQVDFDRNKNKQPGPWEAKHRILLNRISVLDDASENNHCYSYWAVEGGSQFHRGGGDGIVLESPPLNCPPCPSVPEGAIATSHDWGKLQQFIGFQTFSNQFLDESPPFVISAWYVAPEGNPGLFRLNLVVRDDQRNCKVLWDSGILTSKEGEWQQAEFLIKGYPKGIRSVMVKIAGKSQAVDKPGFHGTKFTDVRLRFVSVAELQHYAGYAEGVFVTHPSQP